MALSAYGLPNPTALLEYGDALEKGWGQAFLSQNALLQ